MVEKEPFSPAHSEHVNGYPFIVQTGSDDTTSYNDSASQHRGSELDNYDTGTIKKY